MSTNSEVFYYFNRDLEYQQDAPYNPSIAYPEYPFSKHLSSSTNKVYEAIRELFHSMRLDINSFGTKDWNPLGHIIKENDQVLIKPNLVRHYHPLGYDTQSIMTHGSIIRVILDYVYIALKGTGSIIIGDAPLQSCDFEKIIEDTGLNQIKLLYDRVTEKSFLLNDYRLVHAVKDSAKWSFGERLVLSKQNAKGDPSGYTPIDLGEKSLLKDISDKHKLFKVTDYDGRNVSVHHNETVNEYIIPNSIFSSNVVINIPKLKTHRKAGITCAMKNLVGINGHKDWLPHHRTGAVKENGDEYQNKNSLKRIYTKLSEYIDRSQSIYTKSYFNLCRRLLYKIIKRTAKDLYFEGSWHGNDTLWRTIIDLNRILIYANGSGFMSTEPQRKILHIVDAILAGEHEGPLEPTPKKCNLLISGYNSVAVDTVAAKLMGFDYQRIPACINGYKHYDFPLTSFNPEEILICGKDHKREFKESILDFEALFKFKPPNGWLKFIET